MERMEYSPDGAGDQSYLDGLNPSIVASGHAAFDLSASRQVRRGIDVNFAAENFANRGYYETQNYFVSRLLAKRR